MRSRLPATLAGLLAGFVGTARAEWPPVVVVPVPVSCWDEATYFRTNYGDQVVDFCHAGRSRHYIPGEPDCFYVPVHVCSVFTPPTCPAGCPGGAGCPACNTAGTWSTLRTELPGVPFACPEGHPPPECESRLARPSVPGFR